MGYFSNGTEGEIYEDQYCNRCVHMHPESSCPCLDAHVLWDYQECDNMNSILHKMIPFTKEGLGNDQCIFFKER